METPFLVIIIKYVFNLYNPFITPYPDPRGGFGSRRGVGGGEGGGGVRGGDLFHLKK